MRALLPYFEVHMCEHTEQILAPVAPCQWVGGAKGQEGKGEGKAVFTSFTSPGCFDIFAHKLYLI